MMEGSFLKIFCEDANRTLDNWVRSAQDFYQTRPNTSEALARGFRRLKGSEVNVGNDLDYTETIKALKGELNTDGDPIKKYAETFITVISASIIYNKNKENLEIYMEIYTQDPGENPRLTTREDDSEVRLKRIFKRRFRDLGRELKFKVQFS